MTGKSMEVTNVDVNVRPPKPFVIGGENDLAAAWKLWLQQFTWYEVATNLSKKPPEVQVAVFMSAIGPDAAVIYNTFNLTLVEEKSLDTIKARFTRYFTPKANETYERYVFNQITQKEEQQFEEFLTNLKSKIKNCAYGNLESSILRDRIVIGIKSDSTRERLLAEDDLTLQKTIDICRSIEQVKMQVTSMKQAIIVDTVTNSRNRTAMKYKKQEKDETYHCKRCDTRHGQRSCPAFGKVCKQCRKKNHFSKCCKTKKVQAVKQKNYADSVSEDSDAELYVSAVDMDVDTEDWYEMAVLESKTKVKFKLDSGSQCNVITKKLADKVKCSIQPSTTKYLMSFSNHKIPVLGETKIQTSIKNFCKQIKFIVIENEVTPILGKITCVKLNLMKRIDSITTDDDLYEGIGCLKQFKYDIDLIDNPKLPIHPARKVPHILREKVKKELDSMVKQKIIKPVTEPTPAVSPMVVVRKNNKIRLCIDPSEINKNLKRRFYPLNTVEEIASRLSGSSWFTLLDCKKGFWQLRVTQRTSEYLTFSTPFGRYSCLRMPFGLASAPEVFQQVMSSLLANVKNAEVSMDDVLLHASSKQELERITNKVLNKYKEAGLKLNKEKCVFNAQIIKFLGHIITKDGLMPDPEKLETIDKLKKPENVKELQRFLGLITYLSKFIKNLADITAPLRQLLQKDIEWYWDIEQNNAFLELKRLLKNPPVLGFYDPKAPILISVDASSYACGGVLMQNERPIAYCAKSFTKTEQNYSQLEKEANAILVACKKFHSYIWGCKDLTIETDHKPLDTIFKKPLTDAPPRLQRMFYQILPYNAKITYKKGKELYVADTLSRDCRNLSSEEMNDNTLEICAICPFSDNRREDIVQEINKNEELKELKDTILKGWPKNIKEVNSCLKKYWYYRETLSVYNNLIFKNDRVWVPQSMVPLVMKQCHLSHKGIHGTLQLARDYVYWPTMTKDLTDYVKDCRICQKIQKDNPMETILEQNVPDRPWSIVASDLFQLNGKDYLVIVDAYSGYFDFKEMPNTSSLCVIKELKRWFSVFGIPNVLQTDNGKQYDSTDFKKFAKLWNFNHRRSSPYFARSNGLAERYVQEAKNLLKKCLDEKSDIYLALLMHRNTPRDNLGSPVQRLMGRRTKTILPIKPQKLKPKLIKNVSEQLKNIKEKEKKYADRGKLDSKEYQPGEKILLRQQHKQWVPAQVVAPASDGPRSYIVKTEDGSNYRRNSWYMKPAGDQTHEQLSLNKHPMISTDPQVPPTIELPKSPAKVAAPTTAEPLSQNLPATAPTLPAIRTTRSGRVVVPPKRFQ